MVNKQGTFIAIEGAEGSGKSSVISYLKEQFPEILFTREPGGTPYAEHIREVMVHSEHAGEGDGLTYMLLIFASRRTHLINKIIPALETGKTIITDRFAASSWAHNVRAAKSKQAEQIFQEIHDAVVGAFAPHYIFLDVNPLIGLERKRKQREQKEGRTDHFERRAIDFHLRSYDGYKEFLQTKPHTCIDASQSLEKVCADVKQVIQKMI